MDLITHGLAGALVAQAGFAQRIGPPAVIALVAGAVLPDIDVVMALVDKLSVIRYHRGLTHSFMGAMLLAVPLAALIYLFGKYKRFWVVSLDDLDGVRHASLRTVSSAQPRSDGQPRIIGTGKPCLVQIRSVRHGRRGGNHTTHGRGHRMPAALFPRLGHTAWQERLGD